MSKLHINTAMLENAYELLRSTPPFRGWNLPHADAIEFRVMRRDDVRGTFHQEGKQPVISISGRCIGTLHSLVTTMAHEMVHLYEDTVHGARPDVNHSSKWHRLAEQVCRIHTWDSKLF